MPKVPAYADALEAIGPAAIKLGQTLATRPDLVGEEAAKDLLRLQDALPPLPFDVIEAQIVASFAKPISTLFASIDPVPVGAASIAQVHRAVTTDGRTVAIKVLLPQFARDVNFVDRFRREAQAAARLNHPNLVGIYDSGADGETQFIVMEFIQGRTLDDFMGAGGRFTVPHAVEVAEPGSVHDLGAVQVTVDLRHGEISVQLHSGDAAARDALRDGLSDLRQQLEDQGLRAGSLEVGAGGADPRRRPDQQPVTRGITIPGGANGAVTDPHLTAAANVPASATALDLRM